MLKAQSPMSRTVCDIVNIVAGFGLALSPWYLGYAAESYAAWNAWIVGAIIGLVALATLFAFHQGEEWANMVLGLWAIAAPWVLGFSAVTDAVTAHVVGGLIVVVAAAAGLWLTASRPFSHA